MFDHLCSEIAVGWVKKRQRIAESLNGRHLKQLGKYQMFQILRKRLGFTIVSLCYALLKGRKTSCLKNICYTQAKHPLGQTYLQAVKRAMMATAIGWEAAQWLNNRQRQHQVGTSEMVTSWSTREWKQNRSDEGKLRRWPHFVWKKNSPFLSSFFACFKRCQRDLFANMLPETSDS